MRLGESQTGIKVAGRNLTNLRYTDDIIVKKRNEVGIKSLLRSLNDKNEKPH